MNSLSLPKRLLIALILALTATAAFAGIEKQERGTIDIQSVEGGVIVEIVMLGDTDKESIALADKWLKDLKKDFNCTENHRKTQQLEFEGQKVWATKLWLFITRKEKKDVI